MIRVLAVLATACSFANWPEHAHGQTSQDAAAQAPAAPGEVPAGDVIFARRVLMGGIDLYMQEIEAFAQEAEEMGTEVPFEAAEAADIVSVKLMAFPHLFPAGTDIWSEEAEAEDPTSVSLALPEVWQNFADFYARGNQAAQQAFDLSRTAPRDAAWIAAARDLRAQCDACHADYTRLRPRAEIEPPLPVID